ncbi:hypothetical protein CLF_111925 [Clonorchis sinensis]|uniref:Uncharacterized protein n=1 Tax=Clonorchis sinensis TaxID=79923 RepID=G7YVJ6_CLOSI|nr:hypothetical protein CLF_111925 [Clonorchis sinensis]
MIVDSDASLPYMAPSDGRCGMKELLFVNVMGSCKFWTSQTEVTFGLLHLQEENKLQFNVSFVFMPWSLRTPLVPVCEHPVRNVNAPPTIRLPDELPAKLHR